MPLLYTDRIFLEHETGRHPECPARLESVFAALESHPVGARCPRGAFDAAPLETVARIHDPAYIEVLREATAAGGGRIEADTVVSARSFDAALRAVGAATAAVDAVLAGPVRRATCLARPPGHHALPTGPMGFCLFNNVAIAARHAQAVHGVRRILIVDWDVHHGNGTQDVFWRDGEVHFLSVHRFPFYPGSGDVGETGEGPGLGATWNLPLRFGVSRREYLARFESLLTDAAQRCRPELVLVSAGFDAHRRDPVGSLGLESEDFAPLTQRVLEVADAHCGGRLVSLLEGGYDLQALAESVCVHLETIVAHEDREMVEMA